MAHDDRLFTQCLIVAATVVACAVCILLLAPPLSLAWDENAASTGLFSDATRWLSARGARTHAVVSRGPRPAPASVQTAELLAGIDAHVSAASLDRRAHRESAPSEPPGGGLTLETAAHPSPAAVHAVLREVGGEPAAPSGWEQPARALRPAVSVASLPVRVALPALPRAQGAEPPLVEDDDEPLPEFRRYLVRAQQCAVQAARAAGGPLAGKVVLRFTVEDSGWVRRARAVRGTLHDADARDCLVGALRAERFFDPRPEPITVERTVVLAR